MKFLERYINFTEKFIDTTGKAISWLTTVLVLVVCYDVFTRYFLKMSSVAVQEMEWHLFALIFLLGAAYTLKTENHVRVDVFYSKLSAKGKAWVNLFGTIIFLIPFCLMLIFASQNFVINSFNIGETSPDPGGLPGRYILKSIIPIAFFLILIQSFSLMFKSILIIFDRGKK
jgi:TRAP-type mannitol/chloroaromatic compound transport system permease small subunit